MPLLTITAPGYYAITSDYTATGPADDAVVVAPGVHNVTLLLYSRLICPTSFTKARQNAALRFNDNHACTVIGMGGHIRGFGWGLRADSCNDMYIQQIHVMDALMRGVRVEGNAPFVRDCFVRNVYGSTFSEDQYCIGVEVFGERPRVIGNVVDDFRGTDDGEGVGISITDRATGGLVKGNTSMGSLVDGELRPKSIAYWCGGDSDIDFTDNHGANAMWGLLTSSTTSGFARNNSFRNCAYPCGSPLGDWDMGAPSG